MATREQKIKEAKQCLEDSKKVISIADDFIKNSNSTAKRFLAKQLRKVAVNLGNAAQKVLEENE